MYYDKAVDSQKLNSDLTKLANAIREQSNTTAALAFPDEMAEAINGLKNDYLLELRITNELTSYDNPNLQSLSQGAFFGCTKLTSVNLPNVTDIHANAFYATSVSAFKTTTKEGVFIYSLAFSNSNVEVFDFKNLMYVHSSGLKSEKLKTLIIRNEDTVPTAPVALPKMDYYIYVPSAMLEAYKAATNWSAYADQIRAIEDYPEITGGAEE